MKSLCRFIKEKFHIVHEAEQEAGELIMKISLVFFNKFDTRQAGNDCLQRFFGLGTCLSIPKRHDCMAFISGLSRDTVWA